MGKINKRLKYYMRNYKLITCLGSVSYTHLDVYKRQNINWEEGTIQIRGTMQRIRTFRQGETRTKIIISDPKSRSSNREIPVPSYLLDYLKKLKGNGEGYILAGKKKEYLEPRTLQYRFKKILEQLGIPYFNFHMLRHIFATNCRCV